jgi:hypothetical protein
MRRWCGTGHAPPVASRIDRGERPRKRLPNKSGARLCRELGREGMSGPMNEASIPLEDDDG